MIAVFIGDKKSSISNTFKQVTFLNLGNFKKAQSIRSLLEERLNRRANLDLTDQIYLDSIIAKIFAFFFYQSSKLGLASLSPSLDFSVLKFLHFSFLRLLNHSLPGFYLFLY